jgi:hypothetical protein
MLDEGEVADILFWYRQWLMAHDGRVGDIDICVNVQRAYKDPVLSVTVGIAFM